uniref:Uncharacterized protein n=1 Tax=Arundo donax TaxID=35708 RepID=A0A0A9C0V9_ARUDO
MAVWVHYIEHKLNETISHDCF